MPITSGVLIIFLFLKKKVSERYSCNKTNVNVIVSTWDLIVGKSMLHCAQFSSDQRGTERFIKADKWKPNMINFTHYISKIAKQNSKEHIRKINDRTYQTLHTVSLFDTPRHKHLLLSHTISKKKRNITPLNCKHNFLANIIFFYDK